MSKLSKLYQILENSEELGLRLNEDVIKQTNELEEELIKKEILPIVQNNIEPALRPVRRDIVLVVEYSPDKPLQLKLSRKVNISEVIEAKIIEPDPQVEHKEIGKTKSHEVKQPRTALRITLPDGRIINHKQAADSLVEFVQYVGVMRVRSLGWKVNRVPFISNTKDAKYATSQHTVSNGWYVMTCSDTKTKKKQVEKIAENFGINVKVEII